MKRWLWLLGLLLPLLAASPVTADWDPGTPAKWIQLPDLAETGIDVNCSPIPRDYILADDFLCTETGPITGIHIWASWLQDLLPGGDPHNVTFQLAIHADIPASQNPDGYSIPGPMLWLMDFQPGTFTARRVMVDLTEGWLDPPTDYIPPPADTMVWQYNFFIDETMAFIQEGTAAAPVVYWLSVKAWPMGTGEERIGWKTSTEHWNDDAVWGEGSEPYPGPWYELRYPLGHPWAPESIDLSFVIEGPEQFEELDFGDAPDANYRTLLASNGPRHLLSPVWMGPQIDAEPDGQPTPPADGDDLNGLPDEDGVVFTSPLMPGNPATVDVIVNGGGMLDAWVDFGADGSFDAVDQIFASAPLTAGLNSLTYTVPASAMSGAATYARFRLSPNGGLGPDGVYADGTVPPGEVEDYQVFIEEGQAWKWIQPPDLQQTGIDVDASPLPGGPNYILADDFLCTQNGLITEIVLWGSWLDDHLPFGQDPLAMDFILSFHKDIPANQNPDGYSMPGEVLWVWGFPAASFRAEVHAANIEEGWLNAPHDYLFPADWTCWKYTFTIPPEVAFLQKGTPESPVVYWLDVKAIPHDQTALWGWKTTLEHWNDDAVWGDGDEPYSGFWWELRYPLGHPMELESIDLAFALQSTEPIEEYDWGDAPDPTYPTYAASNGAVHLITNLFLGATVDAEPDGQPDATATGDDLANVDDEDGVVFTSPIKPGQAATVDVTASAAGLLDAWLDFNDNGNWEPAEQIFASVALAPGLNSLSFSVPATAVENAVTFARFRLSATGGLAPGGVLPTGAIPVGEVEDYEVTIEDRFVFKWIQRPDLSPLGIDVNASLYPSGEYVVLADDWLCTSEGYVTDIHVYGSWLNDYIPFAEDPLSVKFTLSIHADIPADESPTGYSTPGELLWLYTFDAGQFHAFPFAQDIEEGWLDPPEGYFFPADWTCWRYEFHVDPHLAFHQEGTEDQPVVYWLDVQAMPHDPEAIFGWKTSLDHWNDDAVWGLGSEPFAGPWRELIYPPQHELHPQSIDLAFALYEDLITDAPQVPERSGLLQNVPNPFNPGTAIRFTMPAEGGYARVAVFDLQGRLVRVLVDGIVPGGERSVPWDGRDADGRAAPAGVYLYQLEGPHGTEARKMTLIR